MRHVGVQAPAVDGRKVEEEGLHDREDLGDRSGSVLRRRGDTYRRKRRAVLDRPPTLRPVAPEIFHQEHDGPGDPGTQRKPRQVHG